MERIRNFAIIAHIDHGKTTLASLLMKMGFAGSGGSDIGGNNINNSNNNNNNSNSNKNNNGRLDYLKEEMDRGITIRSKVVTIPYGKWTLNMIDTPGHPDFKSQLWMKPIQGVLLLIDAQSGIQGQTLHHCHMARRAGLAILPVLTKIDKGTDRIDHIINEVKDLLGMDVLLDSAPLLLCSSKTGQNIEMIIPAIIERIPPPTPVANNSKPSIHVMSYEHPFYVVYVDGGTRIERGAFEWNRQGGVGAGGRKKIVINNNNNTNNNNNNNNSVIIIEDLGYLEGSERYSKPFLEQGMIGYIRTKDPIVREAEVDYYNHNNYQNQRELPPPPLFTLEAYPSPDLTTKGKDSVIKRLKQCCEASEISLKATSNAILGHGLALSFQGSLQATIFKDSATDIVWIAGQIGYLVLWNSGKTTPLRDREDCKGEVGKIEAFLEPLIAVKITFPPDYLESVRAVLNVQHSSSLEKDAYFTSEGSRIFFTNNTVVEEGTLLCTLKTHIPEAQIQSLLKELTIVSKGFAIMEGCCCSALSIVQKRGVAPPQPQPLRIYRPTKLSSIGLRINNIPIATFSAIVPETRAQQRAKEMTAMLRQRLPHRQYHQAIQAVSLGFGKTPGMRVLSRDNISPIGKDVTAKCYGGDLTRKAKLLEQQKRGKTKLKNIMSGGGAATNDHINLDTKVFIELMGGGLSGSTL